ncbi:uncharacterized protein J8A68_002337 [[Candida] subhashii]|uniref:Acetyl-CoA transporter n=1 Tax=[Candida] subhashii TaxID=561895 RepID=A0A8J5QDJ6_9ASCO|nr:uncharacterized protein J8A68_002337 [[Candida] subhashii]KAG7664154.1 hypothetical protein J8A68_002337 [[Candida] subhashii]
MSEDSIDFHRRHSVEEKVDHLFHNLGHAAFDEENNGLLLVTNPEFSTPSSPINHSQPVSSSPYRSEKQSQSQPVARPQSDRLLPMDRKPFIILVILYILQGVPVGLAFGSIPFILKSKLTYSQVGLFSFATYPYSLKLLWSPFVDSIYNKRIGRRKSWIIPIQFISGMTMLYLSKNIDELVSGDNPAGNLGLITMSFFMLIFFCATQDIAVDGWALTCLSKGSLSFASTAQTIGINTGYFSSFTVFLALSSPDFANRYLRTQPLDVGLFSLGSYLRFWGWMYLIVTVILILWVPEDPPHLYTQLAKEKSHDLYNPSYKTKSDLTPDTSSPTTKWKELLGVYESMYQVLKLPNVQTFIIILLISKLGFQVNEAATNLKLLEKGLSKEDLSITVLIDFPFELIFGYYAARWSNGKSPLKPWIWGYIGRLIAAGLAQLVVYFFPEDGKIGRGYFVMIILQHLLGSFMSTIQFVSLCAFHTKIADPSIGGTYMTTLNTLSNYGGTWPRIFIFYLIDQITQWECVTPNGARFPVGNSDAERQRCWNYDNGGGVLSIVRDGYFYTNALCIVMGILILIWVKKKAFYLQSLPNSAWRVKRE